MIDTSSILASAFNDATFIEGSQDEEPKLDEIELYLANHYRHYQDIHIFFDDFQGFWRWSSLVIGGSMRDSKESMQKPIIENQFGFTEETEEFDVNEFKVKLNTFMIENAPSALTIWQAENVMVQMIDSIWDIINPPSEVSE